MYDMIKGKGPRLKDTTPLYRYCTGVVTPVMIIIIISSIGFWTVSTNKSICPKFPPFGK